jgi:hypothetical protein
MLVVDTQTSRRSRAFIVCAVAILASAVLGAAVAHLPLRDVGTLSLVVAVAVLAVVATHGRQRLLLAVGAIAYVGAIHWVYLDVVVPLYAYSGLIDSGVTWPSLVIVSMIAVAPVAWLPIRIERPSDALLWPLYLFGYVPAAAIPIYILGPSLSTVLPFELTLAAAFGVLGLMQRLPRMAGSWAGLSDRRFVRLLVILGLGGIAYLIVVFAPTSPPPDIASVYVTRAQYATAAVASPGAGYFVIWLGNAIYPFLVTLGLSRSRLLLFGLGIAGQILVYTITGLKTILFSMVFLPLLYLAIRYARRYFGTLGIWAAVSVLALSTGATLVTGSVYPLALFATRLIAIPGQLTAYYYDFFSSHATYLLSHSFLSRFIEARYDIDPPYLIGRLYLHTVVDANANIWADAMANFGLVGIIAFTIILAVVLWILDSVASGRDLRIIGPVVGFAGLYLANAALFTQILTGGIALTVGLVILMPRIRTYPGTTPTAPAPSTMSGRSDRTRCATRITGGSIRPAPAESRGAATALEGDATGTRHLERGSGRDRAEDVLT